MQKVKIQVQSGEFPQIFRFQFESLENRFRALCSFIEGRNGVPPDFVLRYRDDEGEMITIANDVDVTEALDTAEGMNSTLKIYVGGVQELNAMDDLAFSLEPSQDDEHGRVSPADPFVEEPVEEVLEEVAAPPAEVSVHTDALAPRIDPMERVCLALEELLKVYRGRFGVLLLVELNRILQHRDIHPMNYPAEIAMIINTQNQFLEVLQNPLYLDVVGPALFKVLLPEDFIARVNANASLLKQLDGEMIADFADSIIGGLCSSAFEMKDLFRLRASQPAFDFEPIAVPDDDEVEMVPSHEDLPALEFGYLPTTPPTQPPKGLTSMFDWMPWGSTKKEEDILPDVPIDAPVMSPLSDPVARQSGDLDLLSFVDDALDNSRDEEKASEERPSLIVTPAEHTSYLPVEDEDSAEIEYLEQSMINLEVASMGGDAEVEIEAEISEDELFDVLPPRRLTHPNSLCSLCGMQPITGLRYKCLVCTDMHMCAQCEAEGVHDRTHPVVKFSTATQRLYAPHELSGLRDLIDPSYHHIFFTDLQGDRGNEDAMNMSTYSTVSAASLNPLLMMRYMAESLRNPAALSRVLDNVPLHEDDESIGSSEFEVDIEVDLQQPVEEELDELDSIGTASTAAEFEIAEVEHDDLVDREQSAESEGEEEPDANRSSDEEDLAVPEASPAVFLEAPAPAPAPAPVMPTQARPVYVTSNQYPPQVVTGGQYYYNGQMYQGPPQQPYYYHQQYQQNPTPAYPFYQGQPVRYQPPAPVTRPPAPMTRPPAPPKREEDLNEDFMLEAHPDAPKPEPVDVREDVNESAPAAPPAVVPKVIVPPPDASPQSGYVPPIVSNLPSYPQLRPVEQKVSAVKQAVESAVEPRESAVEDSDVLGCFCGVPLVEMNIGDLGSVVQCDVCNSKVTKGKVFHCFEQDKHGAGGYDMCLRCVQDQINVSRDDRLPRTTQSGDHVEEIAPSAPSAPPSAVSAASASAAAPAPADSGVPPELETHRKFKFFSGLLSLNEMGIGDVETNKKLLKIHKGNVSAVMQQYFDGNVSGYHY